MLNNKNLNIEKSQFKKKKRVTFQNPNLLISKSWPNYNFIKYVITSMILINYKILLILIDKKNL